MPPLCRHTLIEYYDCDPTRLLRAREVKASLLAAVRAGHGTIVKSVFHNFSPYGVSGVVVITESHVTVHTWPEHNYAAVDIFSCSRKLNHAIIRRHLKKAFAAGDVSVKSFHRGRIREPDAIPPLKRHKRQLEGPSLPIESVGHSERASSASAISSGACG